MEMTNTNPQASSGNPNFKLNTNNSGNEIRKRNTAYRMRIGDVLKGHPMMDEGKFLYLQLGERKVVRINLLANCVDKYIQGEKKFASLTLDDASGQLKIKAFGEDIEPLKEINQGDTLQIIGNMREWNGELYMIPEIIKKVDPRWLLVRKLEIQKTKKELPINEKSPIRNIILQKIKEAETEGGIDQEKLELDTEANPEKIKKEIKKLQEEGLIYEPRPGRIRYLG